MPEPRPGDLVTYATMQRYVADRLADELRAIHALLAKPTDQQDRSEHGK